MQMGNRKSQSTKQELDRVVDSGDDFPLCGIQLSFLEKWAAANVKDPKETTAQLCTRLILKKTKKRWCSMIDLWPSWAKKQQANRFVSHSWSYSRLW